MLRHLAFCHALFKPPSSCSIRPTALSIKKSEAQTARLERKVGQLVIEKEFLEKKCVQLGIDLSERP